MDEIIKNYLRVLGKYAESGLKLLRNLEEQIKIHSLEVVTDNVVGQFTELTMPYEYISPTV